ncbi:MAG: hypothetical protein EPN20_01950 [Magnetospirillum sp.]|nr:MAG: hypothetical protein EPN20_01950 [Magnetospirillum sp.]
MMEAIRSPRAEVKVRLEIIDSRSSRPLRAVLAAQAAGQQPAAADLQALAALEAEAAELRARLVP